MESGSTARKDVDTLTFDQLSGGIISRRASKHLTDCADQLSILMCPDSQCAICRNHIMDLCKSIPTLPQACISARISSTNLLFDPSQLSLSQASNAKPTRALPQQKSAPLHGVNAMYVFAFSAAYCL